MTTRKTKIIVSADIGESLIVGKNAKKEAKKAVSKAMSTPTVAKGNHLTVTTYPDGRTELKWDDDALLQEVRAALLSAEAGKSTVAKTKQIRKLKKV